jgi:hypothetical protein
MQELIDLASGHAGIVFGSATSRNLAPGARP